MSLDFVIDGYYSLVNDPSYVVDVGKHPQPGSQNLPKELDVGIDQFSDEQEIK